MDTQTVVIGTHAWFAKEAASTSTVAVKPAASAADWIKFGTIEEAEVESTGDEKEVWGPSPGQLRLVDIITVKAGLTWKFKVKQMSLLMFELMFGTGALSGASAIQYNPTAGTTRKGWLKIQQYDHKDTSINVQDIWVQLKLAGPVTFGEDVATFDVEARVLHSSLNTGTLLPA